MLVKCARCGDEYDNPTVRSQLEADSKLEVCGPCEAQILAEFPPGGEGDA